MSTTKNQTTSSISTHVQVKTNIQIIEGWVTKTFEIDHYMNKNDNSSSRAAAAVVVVPVHTIIILIPGCPGTIDLYVPFMKKLIEILGPGYAGRGCSNAGHDHYSTQQQQQEEDNNNFDYNSIDKTTTTTSKTCIAWTVDGQVLHKLSYLRQMIIGDGIDKHGSNSATKTNNNNNNNIPSFIFISHSSGAHIIQRILIQQSESSIMLLKNYTKLIIHITPFIKMKAYMYIQQVIIDLLSSKPKTVISITEEVLQLLVQTLPESIMNNILHPSKRKINQKIITDLLIQQPTFFENFFHLGTELIQDVPEIFDIPAMRYISKYCTTKILFGQDDEWACKQYHIDELIVLQKHSSILPLKVLSYTYEPNVIHEFISDPDISLPIVIQFCIDTILIQKQQQEEEIKITNNINNTKKNQCSNNESTNTHYEYTRIRSKL